VTKLAYMRSRRWTPLEATIWFSALIVVITLGILFFAGVVGPWVLVVQGVIVAVVGLLRYRGEAEQGEAKH
jgi:fatty acid desaturase